VSPTSVITGPDGKAATARILGDRPGAYGAVASAEGLGSPVTFSAMAMAPPRPGLVLATQPSSEAAAGVPFEQQPEIQLQDPFGAPLNQENVRVSVQIADGGGTLGGSTSARSDGNGRVRFTDLELRGEAGSRTLIFAAEGFTPVTSRAISLRAGPPAPDRSTVSVPNGTAGETTTISIHLEDEFGNPVTDADEALSISVSGANSVSGLPVQDDGEGSYAASYVPVRSGVDMVGIDLRGQPLNGSPFSSTVSPGPAAPSGTTAELTTTRFVFYYTISIKVTVRDAQGNAVGVGGDRVEVSIDGGAFQLLPDRGDGTYSGSFSSFSPNHTMVITLNGTPIQGSPYRTP
jgi:hypothetical protein